MMGDNIKVLVVDDHALFRRGVVNLMHDEPGFVVAGEASSGPEALCLSRQVKPEVVLLDVQMPGGSGVAIVKGLKQEVGAHVLMLTISEKNEDLQAAIKAGADGYLLKSAEPEELCQAVRRVAAGQAVLSPEITARVMQAAARSWRCEPEVSLSPREREVLAELARGATTAEIAQTLIISQSTVKTHIHHILEKLDAANRAEAVALATRMGLLNPTS